MNYTKHITLFVAAVFMCSLSVSAQVDRKDVRAGNRKFGRGEWKEADISYRKALVKDSLSVAANYNLANTLYRQQSYDEAGKMLEKIKDMAVSRPDASDYYYNTGDVAVAKKDWQAAVDAFKESLLRNPGDMDAKENYIYAKKMLENQKNGGGGNNQDQNNQDQNKDQNNGGDQDQNQQNQQNQDQNKDQNQNNDQNNQGQNQQNKGNDGQDQQAGQQPVKISPQQAQQMLKAIQAKEKETQDKVNKEKADALKSRQKEKNW